MTVTGLVLAAGGSTRLGRPKQLLPYRGRTLLDATLAMVRRCGLDQIVVALGGSAAEVERRVDLTGCDLVRNAAYSTGCSSSIAAALPTVEEGAEGIVLLLGDQPGVDPRTVSGLVERARGSAIAVSEYADGTGHPFWLGREIFGRLAALHGDKAVWKLVDEAGETLVRHPVEGPVPRDVDTWADYQELLAERAR